MSVAVLEYSSWQRAGLASFASLYWPLVGVASHHSRTVDWGVGPPVNYGVCTNWPAYFQFDKGCSRNYPRGGGGPHCFSDPSTPRTHNGVRPRPPGHVSALIKPAPLWIRYDLTPTTLSPPPLGHVVNKTYPPQDKKVPTAHPPLRIISGTALNCRPNFATPSTGFRIAFHTPRAILLG